MADDPLVRLALPAEVESVSAARRAVRSAVADHLGDDVVDDAVTVTSELVTNAVLHAQTDVELVVLLEGAAVRIEVHDTSTRLPRRKRYSSESGTGRGLVLVEALSSLAGVDRREGGKVVWAVFGTPLVEPPVVAAASDAAVEDGREAALVEVGGVALPDDELQVAAADASPELRAEAGGAVPVR